MQNRAGRQSRAPRAGRALALLLLCAVSTGPFLFPGARAESPERPTPSVPAGADSLARRLLRQIAREDTIPVDYVYGDWVETRDRRPTIKQILAWCIDDEKHRFDSVHDVSYRERTRTLMLYDPEDPKGRRVVSEAVARIYAEQPDRMARVELGDRTWDSEEKDPEVRVEVNLQETRRSLSDLPFFFQNLDDYRFEILERRILRDRVLYRIGFHPRSEFAAVPEGSFLVDTADYQILRAELSWTRNVPYPLFLKSVDRIVLDREKHRGIWMTDRAQVGISLRKPPGIPMPRRVEFEMRVEDVRLDEGIPDSVWAGR